MSKCKAYKKKTCWFSCSQGSYCSSCTKQKDENHIIDALNGNNAGALLEILQDKKYQQLIQKDDLIDNILRRLYMLDKESLKQYIKSTHNTPTENSLIRRIYTHSDTYLCTVISWMIRNDLYDSLVQPYCLRCITHLMRYGDEHSKQNITYSIQFDLYGPHHINIKSIICKNRDKLDLLTDLGRAIIERDGVNCTFKYYNKILKQFIGSEEYANYTEELAYHPLLHSQILHTDDLSKKENLYLKWRKRKDSYSEELIAKGMHPTRVMQWCMTDCEKEGFSEIPLYQFNGGRAAWNDCF